ncbi:tetratricopeptide repeat protein [Melittangium boletus]|uniref:tetratricopeptide repeat protein n=1 Tax=Melittangium boletus TaxID=83453 RepID=UPI003DA64894
MLSLRAKRHVVLAFATTLATSCTPQLTIHVLKPAPVNLGASRLLTVVQTEGRPGARDFLLQELSHQARAQGHFQVADRTHEGRVVKVAGDSVRLLAPGPAPLGAPGEVGLRLDVHEWSAARKTERPKPRGSKGGTDERPVSFYEGRALVTLTAFTASGDTLLAEQEYTASGRGMDANEALDNAGREVVRHILAHITPHYETRSLRMDDEDRAQQPILQAARTGDMPGAVTQMEAYVRAHPDNAPALYNLGVLLDATGRYPEALERYTQAISLSTKGYYVDMKNACTRQLADQRALSE